MPLQFSVRPRAALLLLSLAGLCTASATQCSGSGCPTATSSALLQVTLNSSSLEARGEPEGKADQTRKAVNLCTVQRNKCMDMEFQPRTSVSGKGIFEVLFEAESINTVYTAKEVQVVVTRHGEDVRWVDALSNFPTILYNKGGPDDLLPSPRNNLQVVAIENTGREDETMLRHVVSQFDDLPDVTVFLQGWPFLHCIGLTETLNRVLPQMLLPHRTKEMVPISGSFWQYRLQDGRLGLVRNILKHHPHTGQGDSRQAAIDIYDDLCRTVLDGPCPDVHWVAEGAQWAVRRERLRSRSKKQYEKAIQLGEGYEKKMRGLVLEAMWPTVWGLPNWDPSSVVSVQRANLIDTVLNHTMATGDHCLDSERQFRLVRSCEEHMAFCELSAHSRHKAGAEAESLQFQKRRPLFNVSSKPWAMQVTLQPSLQGSATWEPDLEGTGSPSSSQEELNNKQVLKYRPNLIVDENGLLMLQPDDASAADAISWTVTAASRKDEKEEKYYLRTPNPKTSRMGFLGCGEDGLARVVDAQVAWEISPSNGLSLFSTEKGLLALSQHNNSYLSCVVQWPLEDPEDTFVNFYLDLQKRTA